MKESAKQDGKMHVAIIGGGPGGLFMFKRLVESGRKDLEITIYESKSHLGQGMPYSREGANDEHVTNVSDNEIPELVTTMNEWVRSAPQQLLERFSIKPENFNEYKVVPRLFFGCYLEAQFHLLIGLAKKAGIETILQFNSEVSDISDRNESGKVLVRTVDDQTSYFDSVIISTGHNWPKKHEGKIPGFFDSPYPPSKLKLKLNHPVAIKGSSLTAIDAIRTLARNNGEFTQNNDGTTNYILSEESKGFRLVIHTRNGLLPAVRFHLDDSHLSSDSLLTDEQVKLNRAENNGFLSLDYVFEKNFKELFIEKDPIFYAKIKDMPMESFVEMMMELREKLDPFVLLKAEYREAEKSIKRHESIYWKEMLAILSFAMNYPAKYFSAEDMLRLQKGLMPLIAIVIAFIPQSSCRDLMALHEAGLLEIIAVGHDSEVITGENDEIIYHYGEEAGGSSVEFKTFVDCTGQPHLLVDDLPFKSLIEVQVVSAAKIMFRSEEAAKQEIDNGNEKVHVNESGNYFLSVSGIAINDSFQLVDDYGKYNERIYIMAVPYIGGYNPDYSGLDFCEAASKKIVDRIFSGEE